MRNNLNKFATCMEVTEEAAPTTPEITFRTVVLLQWYSASSMLLIEPAKKKEEKRKLILFSFQQILLTPDKIYRIRLVGVYFFAPNAYLRQKNKNSKTFILLLWKWQKYVRLHVIQPCKCVFGKWTQRVVAIMLLCHA